METRDILKIALGIVGSLILIVGGLLVYELFSWQGTTVVERTIETSTAPEQRVKHKWEGRGARAISVVKGKRVEGLDETMAERLGNKHPTLETALSDSTFRSKVLNFPTADPRGWEAEWWGETKYGAHYYRVRFALRDGAVTVGPSWVVDLQAEQARPKNVTAQVAETPEARDSTEFYGKSQQIVSAMTSHTFESGVTLGGTLLKYFTQRTDSEQKDAILGWTVQHDRGALFDAYFQWKEGDRQTYAAFEFDYEQKALKAVNLHAGNIMEAGETFEQREAVNILPNSYDASAKSPDERWTGSAGEQYDKPKYRERFQALGAILSRNDLISGIEWLLTSEVNEDGAFAECKEQKRCRWSPEHLEGSKYRVTYSYDLQGQTEKSIAWRVDIDSGTIEPLGRVSELAYRVLHSRS